VLATSARAASSEGAVTGRVLTPNGQPVAGAAVTLDGAVHLSATSAADGGFAFADVGAGTYAVRVAKPGFDQLVRTDVAVAGGASTAIDATLTPSSFSSLQTIGRTSTNVSGRVGINTTTAAIQTIPAQAFVDQGKLQVTKLLEETPGVSLTSNAAGGGSNHASLGAPEYPSIRGALYYQTESLIDGHAVSVGAIGTFNPLLVLPGLLQNIEVAKGPGSMPAEINYAIGGTINYRTLEPTRTNVLTFDAGADGYGGSNTTLRATGSIANHRLDYAFAYATLGTPGPLQNYPLAGSQIFLPLGSAPWSINGQAVPGVPVVVTAPTGTSAFQGSPATQHFSEPLYTCCNAVNTGFNSRGELAKLRYNFSEQTALTVSYLGGQSADNFTGSILASSTPVINFSTFAPPAGYTGSVAAGTPIPFDTQANTGYYEYLLQNLFGAELRTSLGGTTLLARLYSGYDSTIAQEYAPGHPVTFNENAWGGIALCPAGDAAKGAGCVTPGGAAVAPVTTFFNGQLTSLTAASEAQYTIITDHVRGYSLEADRPIGDAVLSLSIDRSNHDSYEYTLSPAMLTNAVVLPPGSTEAFTTALARLQAPLARRLGVTASTYFTWYTSHYTGNGGTTWNDVTHAEVAPRIAFSWHPNPDFAWRFAAGASIAPPYISLLSSPGTNPVKNPAGAAQGYFVNANNGQVAPEKAFGVDLGLDKRVLPTMKFSGDVYFTHLRDMFLTETSQQGTFTPTTGTSAGIPGPLYITQTANLGNARYEGFEVQLESAPPIGVGFKVQGSMTRAFAYGLSPAFYATTAGPNTTNLGVVPEINFQASGNGFNAISPGRIPYSQGYAELTLRTRHSGMFLVGYTYYGPNNAYNEPAFGVVSFSARLGLSPTSWIQLSGDNLTHQYAQPYAALLGGVPVPLVNGKLGAIAASNYGPTTVQLTLHQAVR
jgi:hypothetical protein